MTLGDLLTVILFVLVPVVGVAYLLIAWTRGRGVTPSPVLTTGGGADSVAQAIATHHTSVAQSFVSQINMLSHIAIQALGYLVAQLRGGPDAPLLREPSGEEVVHVVAVGGSYSLDVRFQTSAPPSYQGATVELVTEPEPVRLGVLVEGAGLEVADDGRATLVAPPAGRPVTASFRVTPVTPGPTRLVLEFYRGNAWAQTLDMRLDVQPAGVITALHAGARPALSAAREVDEAECSNPLLALGGEPAPRHVHLRMRAASSDAEDRPYTAQVKAGDQPWRKLDVAVRENDLKEINQDLREALDELRRALGERIEVSPAELRSPEMVDVIDGLARRGNDAFKRLFPDESDQRYLLDALERVEHADVELSTDVFFLAWELLYAPYDAATVDVASFWGFRYNITRVTTVARQRPGPVMALHGPPRIGLYVDHELPHAGTEEVTYFRRLAAEGKIALHDWLADARPESDTAPAGDQRRAFVAYCREHSSDVAHFACHAVAQPNSRDSFLALSSQLRVTLRDMTVDAFRLPGSPLVVLNACGTGVRDPLKTSDFVRSFMDSGGRGVVATECDVPDGFASAFIPEVYDRLLAGEPVARALFAARRQFLDRRGNPLGLIYSAYLPLEMRWVRAPGEGQVTVAARAARAGG